MYIIARHTDRLSGTATPPSSKSQTIRGLLVAAMAQGESVLRNPLRSEDTADAVRVVRFLGAQVAVGRGEMRVRGAGMPPVRTKGRRVLSGNSAITTRFFLPLLGLREDTAPVRVDCGPLMRHRPMQFVGALRRLGMSIAGEGPDGSWPFAIGGKLEGGAVRVSGITSQYVSALLLTLPLASRDSVVSVRGLRERPYVEMTLAWLRERGISYRHARRGGIDRYRIPGGQRYGAFSRTIPGDFSAASCMIVAAALRPGTVVFRGLDMEDLQGDKRIVDILRSMGARIRTARGSVTVSGGVPLRGGRIDASDIPDLVPALAVAATGAAGRTDIVNVSQARKKETDRIRSMAEGLSRLGARVVERRAGLTVWGGPLRGARVRGFRDHRTVMAMSVAGMTAAGTTAVDTAEAVRKTFPGFVTDMRRIGALLTVRP